MEDKINGSARASDGTFWMQPHRRFPTDGREHRSFDRLLELVHSFEKVLPYTANPSIEIVLAAIRDARKRLDEIEYEAVALARGAQWSWRDIAGVLGMSASRAHHQLRAIGRCGKRLRESGWDMGAPDEDLIEFLG